MIAFSLSSECIASISDVGLKRSPATDVVRFMMALQGLQQIGFEKFSTIGSRNSQMEDDKTCEVASVLVICTLQLL